MNKTLIKNIRIWDGNSTIIDNGALLINGQNIESVLTAEQLASTQLPPEVKQIDGGGKLAIPGLVNAHTHLYSSLARGMGLSGFAPTTFTEILQQMWWRMDRALDDDSVRASASVGAMEAARCGVTTLIDHHASPYAVPNSLKLMREAICDEVGLRAALCYEVSDRDGEKSRNEGIAENIRHIEELATGDTMCAAQFGIHASFTVGDETLQMIADGIKPETGIHIHVAEGAEDEPQCVEKHGCRVVQRLDNYGLLRPTSILAHCLHIDQAERDLIAKNDCIVVHNPRSNMNNAVGVFDMAGFMEQGICVGLGTDGLGANLFSELFASSLLQKAHNSNPLAGSFDHLDALLMRNNPAIAKRLLGVDVGQLVAGGPADIAIFDYRSPTPLLPGNILGHMLFGMAVNTMRVSDLFVAGKQVIQSDEFVTVNESEIYTDSAKQAERLWAKAESLK